MCITCGCSSSTDHHHHDGGSHGHSGKTARRIAVEEDVLAENSRHAAANRRALLGHGILALNLMSSPGAGKTALLEATLFDLHDNLRCAVVEGDQQTDYDAKRIAATGTPVHQINTGTGCHLDAHMVGHALEHLELEGLDLLFIENVGNLVCPAPFDLGEHHKVVVLSVTEGEDKPLKYPHMFRNADLLLLNKIDLLPHLDFDLQRCREMALQLNPHLLIFEISAKTGAGLDQWYAWLHAGIETCRAGRDQMGMPAAAKPEVTASNASAST